MSQILDNQVNELKNKNNNFFISYNCNSFNKYIIPYLSSIYPQFNNKWGNKRIPYIYDTRPREINNPPEYTTKLIKKGKRIDRFYYVYKI